MGSTMGRQIGHQSVVSIRASYHGVNTMGQSSSRVGIHRCLRLFVRSMRLDVRIMPSGTRHCDRSNPREVVDTSNREDPGLIFYRFN